MDSLVLEQQQLFERRLAVEVEHQMRLTLERYHSYLARAMRHARNLDGHYVLNANNTNHIARRRTSLQRTMRDASQLDGHYVLNDNNANYIAQRRSPQLPEQLSEHQQQPRHSFQKIIIERGSEPRTCSICLVEFLIDTEAICLPKPCGHVYHEDCILKWLKRSNTCPLCRRPLDMIGQSSQVI